MSLHVPGDNKTYTGAFRDSFWQSVLAVQRNFQTLRDLVANMRHVKERPLESEEGEQGDQGNPGERGPRGFRGLQADFMMGEEGEEGADSFVPGPRGPTGATGPAGVSSGGSSMPLVSDGEDGEDGLEWHPSTKTTDFIHLTWSSAISIAFDTSTIVTENTVIANIGALTQTDSNTKVLIAKTGIYMVAYTGQWDDAATGVQLNQLVTTNLGVLGVNRVKGQYSNFPSWFITLVLKLTAGDKVWGNAYTSVATGLSILGTDTAANGLIIKLLELIP